MIKWYNVRLMSEISEFDSRYAHYFYIFKKYKNDLEKQKEHKDKNHECQI